MNLKDLIKRLNEDRDFELKFNDVESVEDMMNFASKEGYSIIDKDIEALHRELEYLETGRAELSDDELENVAGGFVMPVGVMPMGAGMGRSPEWATKLVSIFIGGKKPGTQTAGSGINAQKLPSTGIQDMKTTKLPGTSGMPKINTLQHGTLIQTDHIESI